MLNQGKPSKRVAINRAGHCGPTWERKRMKVTRLTNLLARGLGIIVVLEILAVGLRYGLQVVWRDSPVSSSMASILWPLLGVRR